MIILLSTLFLTACIKDEPKNMVIVPKVRFLSFFWGQGNHLMAQKGKLSYINMKEKGQQFIKHRHFTPDERRQAIRKERDENSFKM